MYDVSIILLTYNRLEYTKTCIKSIYDNLDMEFELVIVDNGSSDGTIEYLKENFKDKDNIKLIFNEENLMPAGGNRIGLENASPSKCYLLCDNDGLFENPKWYYDGLNLLNKIKDVGIVHLRKSIWISELEENDVVHELNGIKYYYTDKVASFSMLNERVKNELVSKLSGKWIGVVISKIAAGINEKSIRITPGYILDQSDLDYDNPEYREQYIDIWSKKKRLNEFYKRFNYSTNNKKNK